MYYKATECQTMIFFFAFVRSVIMSSNAIETKMLLKPRTHKSLVVYMNGTGHVGDGWTNFFSSPLLVLDFRDNYISSGNATFLNCQPSSHNTIELHISSHSHKLLAEPRKQKCCARHAISSFVILHATKDA